MEYNYNNLFLDALDTDRQKELEEIKANKKFALKLLGDLNMLFHTCYEINDQQEGVVINIKKLPTHNWYGSFSFVVDRKGIKFNTHNLGYYYTSQFKSLGALYEKYKDTGTKAEDNFLREDTTRHGNVRFVIPINRNSDNLKDTLRDIIYLMEQNQYTKKF